MISTHASSSGKTSAEFVFTENGVMLVVGSKVAQTRGSHPTWKADALTSYDHLNYSCDTGGVCEPHCGK